MIMLIIIMLHVRMHEKDRIGIKKRVMLTEYLSRDHIYI